MLLDRGEMRADVGDKCVRVSIAEKCRDPFQAGATRRQHMRLRVVDHLQAVLKASEKAVVVNQSCGDRRIDAARSGEAPQRLACRPDLQLVHPAAPDQLLGLRKEFDFPDPAAPGLYVVALDSDAPAPFVSVDLALDRMDVLDRRKVEVLSPDKRPQLAQEALPGDTVAGNRARLDQRRAFPILPDTFVIGEGRRDRHRERRGCRVRSKPKIGTEYISVTSVFIQNAYEIARQADKE